MLHSSFYLQQIGIIIASVVFGETLSNIILYVLVGVVNAVPRVARINSPTVCIHHAFLPVLHSAHSATSDFVSSNLRFHSKLVVLPSVRWAVVVVRRTLVLNNQYCQLPLIRPLHIHCAGRWYLIARSNDTLVTGCFQQNGVPPGYGRLS